MFKLTQRLWRPLSQSVRTFLSDSFSCREVWDKRLLSPILQKVDVEELYTELDNKYSQGNGITGIDVDIFANAIKSDSHLDELGDLVHKLRLSPETASTLDSTHHAVVRAFLNFGEREELMNVLNDRLNYGIFLDNYTTLLLLDTFLKDKDYRNAAKVSAIHMLQEDFSNPLISLLSLYSCHKYLLEPTEWAPSEEPEKEPEEDEEETLVRVKYLRNPYFDGHFDLVTSDDMIGKTLMLVGDSLNSEIGKSYKLVGCGLFKKLDVAQELLTQVIASKEKLHSEGVTLFKERLDKLTEVEPTQLENLKSQLSTLESSKLIEQGSLLSLLESDIKKLVAKEESSIIQSQTQAFSDWENNRELILKKTLESLRVKRRLAEVERLKTSLAEREEQLFFFENEDKIDLQIEGKRVIYPRKWHGKKKKKKEVTEEYIPPEMRKRHG